MGARVGEAESPAEPGLNRPGLDHSFNSVAIVKRPRHSKATRGELTKESARINFSDLPMTHKRTDRTLPDVELLMYRKPPDSSIFSTVFVTLSIDKELVRRARAWFLNQLINELISY